VGSTNETDTFTGGEGKDLFVFAFSVTGGGEAIASSAANLIITDATKKDTLLFDSGGNGDFNSKAELSTLVNVSDDGTDVFVEFPHSGGSIVITLEGLGESDKDVNSLNALKKLVKLDFV
jgi:hypothetical protein